MAREIIWSPEAEITFQQIVEYLQAEWSESDVENFVRKTDQIISLIRLHPLMYRKTTKPDVHEVLVSKQNLLVYKVYPARIVLITFWDARQNPRTKKF